MEIDKQINRDKLGLLKHRFLIWYYNYKLKKRYIRYGESFNYGRGEISGILLIYHLDGLIEDSYFMLDVIEKRTFKLAWKHLLKQIGVNIDFVKE